MVFDFCRVLEIFDYQEGQSKNQGYDEKTLEPLPVALLRRVDRHRHRQAADNQHHRVGSAERHVEQVAAIKESFRIGRAIDRVSQEQPAEKHDFRQQEDPHSDHSRFLLLFHADEMMRQTFYMSRVFSQDSSPMWGKAVSLPMLYSCGLR